jgi:hypothetical protein
MPPRQSGSSRQWGLSNENAGLLKSVKKELKTGGKVIFVWMVESQAGKDPAFRLSQTLW